MLFQVGKWYGYVFIFLNAYLLYSDAEIFTVEMTKCLGFFFQNNLSAEETGRVVDETWKWMYLSTFGDADNFPYKSSENRK